MMRKILTLCLVYQPPKILLGMKKRGFGVGRWNGFGGKVKDGETVKQTVKREMEEEVGIVPKSFEDDKLWFPLFLEGKKFKGKFLFDGWDKILKYNLKEVNLI